MLEKVRSGLCSEEPGVACVGAVKAASVFHLPFDQLGLSLFFVLLSTGESCENILFHVQMKMEILCTLPWVTFTKTMKSQLVLKCVSVYM